MPTNPPRAYAFHATRIVVRAAETASLITALILAFLAYFSPGSNPDMPTFEPKHCRYVLPGIIAMPGAIAWNLSVFGFMKVFDRNGFHPAIDMIADITKAIGMFVLGISHVTDGTSAGTICVQAIAAAAFEAFAGAIAASLFALDCCAVHKWDMRRQHPPTPAAPEGSPSDIELASIHSVNPAATVAPTRPAGIDTSLAMVIEVDGNRNHYDITELRWTNRAAA